MRLLVLSRYRNGATAYEPGQEIDVAEAMGEFLQRDSPGTFATEKAAPAAKVATETTISGIPAHDRRARGGQSRQSAAQPETTTGEAQADGKE